MLDVDQLEKLLVDYQLDWYDSERLNFGNIRPADEDVTFHMRVGLHMQKSTQAIMACGFFIRTRPWINLRNFRLARLEPKHPDDALYERPARGPDYDFRGFPQPLNQTWHPKRVAVDEQAPAGQNAVLTPSQLYRQQQAMLQAQGMGISNPPPSMPSILGLSPSEQEQIVTESSKWTGRK